MSFLLDTNVLSEPLRPAPEARVIEWLRRLDEDLAFVSVVTLAEIRRGIAGTPDGKRKARLVSWLDIDLRGRFSGRIIDIDEKIAMAWGDITSDCSRRGRPLKSMDGFIAATASVRGLIVVTRNVRDFEVTGVEIIDPWQA